MKKESILHSDIVKTLKEIKKIVENFLKINGGYSNGYNTYIEGKVRCDCSGALKWSTPKRDDLTGHQVHKLGFDLSEKIRKILINSKNLKCILFESDYLEDGCYKTFIMAKESMKIVVDD